MIDVEYKGKLYLQNLVRAIHEYASFEFQQDAWIGKGRYVSSYVEIICMLYDNCDFESYFANKDFEKLGYSSCLIELFERFNEEIKIFKNRKEVDYWGEHLCCLDLFWSDSQWIKISEIAKTLLKEWSKEDRLVYETLKSVIEEERIYGIYEDSSSYFD